MHPLAFGNTVRQLRPRPISVFCHENTVHAVYPAPVIAFKFFKCNFVSHDVELSLSRTMDAFSFEIFKTEAPEYAMLMKTPALNRCFKSLAFTRIYFSPERLQDIDRTVEKKTAGS